MKRFLATLSFIGLLALGLPKASADTTTFNFTGDCLDCTNPQGQLILQNYTDGTALESTELVSFTYTSNLADVSVTSSNVLSLEGSLGSTAGSYQFTAVFSENGQDYTFATDPAGDWCYGLTGTCSEGGGSIGVDHGTNGVFSPAVAATPEPDSLALLATGFFGVASLARRRMHR